VSKIKKFKTINGILVIVALQEEVTFQKNRSQFPTSAALKYNNLVKCVIDQETKAPKGDEALVSFLNK